jgi:hypothetical protein
MAFSTQSESARLWLFSLDPTTRRLRSGGTAVTEEGAEATTASLSPDGAQLLYGLPRPGIEGAELWNMNLKSGARELVAPNIGGGVAPPFSPDGTMVAYYTLRLGGQTGRRVALVVRPLVGSSAKSDGSRASGCYSRLAGVQMAESCSALMASFSEPGMRRWPSGARRGAEGPPRTVC